MKDGERVRRLPLALAAVRPAWVRSLIMSSLNSASAPKMWKISFPPEVVVSIVSVIDLKPMPRLLRRGYRLDEVLERAA